MKAGGTAGGGGFRSSQSWSERWLSSHLARLLGPPGLGTRLPWRMGKSEAHERPCEVFQ